MIKTFHLSGTMLVQHGSLNKRPEEFFQSSIKNSKKNKISHN